MFTNLSRHGLVERSAVIAAGTSARRWRLAHERGDLLRIHPCVSRLRNAPPTEPQRILAAVWSAGAGALASHRSAAYLWDAPVAWHTGETPVDVLVPHHRRPGARTGAVLHRTVAADDLQPSWRQGIPCTNPLRTLVDLGAVSPDEVPVVLADFAIRRLVLPSAAAAVLSRHAIHGRHGAGPLRRALADWPFGDEAPDSLLEVEIARLFRRERLTGFEFHRVLEGFEVDFAHRAARLVVEGDGFEFHSTREAFEVDRYRDTVLAAAGWQVVRLTWRAVTADPTETAARLRAALRHRLARP